MKAGIVGCGFMGRMHASVYGRLPNAEVVRVHDIRPDRAAAFADEFGATPGTLEELLGDSSVDAVHVCVPTHLHAEFTVAACRVGKHVLCEKPMALNLDDADRMLEEASRAGLRLMIGHCIRFWPEYDALKKLVDSRRLGRLLSLNLTRYGAFPLWATDGWSADESRSGGGVLDMHIHDTDFALYLLGRPMEVESWGSVDARGASHAFTTMQFAGGEVVHLEGGWNFPQGTPFKMAFRAVFERGAAIMDGGPFSIYEEGREVEVPQFEAMAAEGGGNLSDLGGYYREIEYFVDCVRNARPNEIAPPESSRESLAVALGEVARIKARNAAPTRA